MKKFLKIIIYGILSLILFFIIGIISYSWILRPKISLKLLAPKAKLELPVHLQFFPDNQNQFVVVELSGKIKWFSRSSQTTEGIVLDISDSVRLEFEGGLWSIAFDPEFRKNRYFYVFYSVAEPSVSRISRFTMNTDYTASRESELIILEIKQKSAWHNGGMLLFGKDKMLYASIGDDLSRNLLQTRKSLLGSIIRIDVSESTIDKPYKIPPDNPFVSNIDGSLKEIWAYGFRNPWRFSFDKKTQKMYLGDVGANNAEEVDLVEKGKNYGWPRMEGKHCFPIGIKECEKSDLTLPIASFPRIVSSSVTGGYVYRGSSIIWLKGKYIFADHLRGLFSMSKDNPAKIISYPKFLLFMPKAKHDPIKGYRMFLPSLAEDKAGELYVVNIVGSVYQITDISFSNKVKGFWQTLTTVKGHLWNVVRFVQTLLKIEKEDIRQQGF